MNKKIAIILPKILIEYTEIADNKYLLKAFKRRFEESFIDLKIDTKDINKNKFKWFSENLYFDKKKEYINKGIRIIKEIINLPKIDIVTSLSISWISLFFFNSKIFLIA